MFCCTLLYVLSSIAIILIGKRGLIALLNLSSWCLVMVERLFLAVPRGCLQFVIVVIPDHTHLLFFIETKDKKDRHIKGTGQAIVHNDVTIKIPSCQLQVVNSADDVFRPQTNMEVEFALTIQHTQSELEKCKKEIDILKQRESLQVTLNENAEKIKQKEVEILQLMERIDRVKSRIYSDQTGFARPQNTTSCLGIDTPKLKNMFDNIGSLNENKTQSGNAKKKSVITDSETTTFYSESACLEDDKHHIIKQDFDSMNEKLVHNWAKMLNIMSHNKIF